MAKQTPLTIEFRGKDKPEIDGKFSKWVKKIPE
jgi:hypothetical protein